MFLVVFRNRKRPDMDAAAYAADAELLRLARDTAANALARPLARKKAAVPKRAKQSRLNPIPRARIMVTFQDVEALCSASLEALCEVSMKSVSCR